MKHRPVDLKKKSYERFLILYYICRAIKANDGRGNEGFIHEEAIEVVIAREEAVRNVIPSKKEVSSKKAISSKKTISSKKEISSKKKSRNPVPQKIKQKEKIEGEIFHEEEIFQQERDFEQDIVGPSVATKTSINEKIIVTKVDDNASKDDVKKKRKTKRLVCAFLELLFCISVYVFNNSVVSLIDPFGEREHFIFYVHT